MAKPHGSLDNRTKERIGVLAALLIEDGREWNTALIDELVGRWAVSRATVRSYYKKMCVRHARDLASHRERRRADFLLRLRAHQRRADDRGACALLGLEARVSGFFEPPPLAAPPVDESPMSEQEAVSQLAELPVHLLEAALAVAR